MRLRRNVDFVRFQWEDRVRLAEEVDISTIRTTDTPHKNKDISKECLPKSYSVRHDI